MKPPLHILHLEDDAADAALVRSALEAGGIQCVITCVQTRQDFVAALEAGGLDLILSDYSLPAFDGLSALEIVHHRWPDMPFILVSGTLGEERAINSLKSGATDYVLKDHLSRLVPAVRRAMDETKKRARFKQVEIDLKASEERFANAFEYAAIGITLVSPDGKFLKVNRALSELVGYSEAELLTRTFQDITHPDDLKADLVNLRQLLAGDVRFYQMEKRYFHKLGHTVTVLLSVSLVRNLQGEPLYFISQIQDISERKQLEAQFVAAQKMEVIGHLAGGVAHDFNNILVVIMGYSDLLITDLGPDNPLHKFAEEIKHASERAAGLTRQLLIFSRKETVQPVVLDLNDVVAGLDKMLRRLINEHIVMTMALGKSVGRIKADPGYLGQVLMNLVVNARDAMPDGGKLTISTSDVTLDEHNALVHGNAGPGTHVMLSVSDTGTGMTDEVKAHLFEAFYTTKPVGKGTGLGLATCQTIVKQCGGHLCFDSTLGQGTTFTIYFPRVDLPVDEETRFIQNGAPAGGTETLLVVEDEPTLRHLACGVLRSRGYEVLSATNGQDALHVAREHQGSPIRLVVTDVVMPLMGGKVMAEWLKTTYPGLKILFTSGYTDEAISHHGVLEPGVAFLPKPYTPATLARKVRVMLDAK
jgi:two-component system cell cycle sensor histidine kinase/response regulator CckA